MIRSFLQIAFLFMLAMLACQSWAETYDPLLLRAQASIFPKIILLDKHLDKKSPGNVVEIAIVCTDQDRYIAQQLKDSIKEKYGNSLGNKKLIINIRTFKDVNQSSLETAYIVLQGSESEFDNIVSRASRNNRIVFSYSYTDFKYNSLISLYVKEKTYIYLNKASISLYDIKFSPVFYKITKIIE